MHRKSCPNRDPRPIRRTPLPQGRAWSSRRRRWCRRGSFAQRASAPWSHRHPMPSYMRHRRRRPLTELGRRRELRKIGRREGQPVIRAAGVALPGIAVEPPEEEPALQRLVAERLPIAIVDQRPVSTFRTKVVSATTLFSGKATKTRFCSGHCFSVQPVPVAFAARRQSSSIGRETETRDSACRSRWKTCDIGVSPSVVAMRMSPPALIQAFLPSGLPI